MRHEHEHGRSFHAIGGPVHHTLLPQKKHKHTRRNRNKKTNTRSNNKTNNNSPSRFCHGFVTVLVWPKLKIIGFPLVLQHKWASRFRHGCHGSVTVLIFTFFFVFHWFYNKNWFRHGFGRHGSVTVLDFVTVFRPENRQIKQKKTKTREAT